MRDGSRVPLRRFRCGLRRCLARSRRGFAAISRTPARTPTMLAAQQRRRPTPAETCAHTLRPVLRHGRHCGRVRRPTRRRRPSAYTSAPAASPCCRCRGSHRSRDGGTGRRAGLKIQYWRQCASSSLAPGTRLQRGLFPRTGLQHRLDEALGTALGHGLQTMSTSGQTGLAGKVLAANSFPGSNSAASRHSLQPPNPTLSVRESPTMEGTWRSPER